MVMYMLMKSLQVKLKSDRGVGAVTNAWVRHYCGTNELMILFITSHDSMIRRSTKASRPHSTTASMPRMCPISLPNETPIAYSYYPRPLNSRRYSWDKQLCTVGCTNMYNVSPYSNVKSSGWSLGGIVY